MKKIIPAIILAASMSMAMGADKPITEQIKEAGEKAYEKTKEVAKDAGAAISKAADKTEVATRNAWNKTKAYFSEDPPVYREGATTTLTDLGREITDLKLSLKDPTPVYYQTRLQALDQQYNELTAELLTLTEDQIKSRETGRRAEFDRRVHHLEMAIDQARAEAAPWQVQS